MRDLTVIGAGPVGSYLASLCSARMSVLVLEGKRMPGSKACSGLVSGRIKDILPGHVIETPGLIQHSVKGARIHFLGHELLVRKKRPAAYIVDRDMLDKRLAEHAESMGCDVRFGCRVGLISVKPDRVRLVAGKVMVESKMVAGCGGALSVTARQMGSKPPELLNGIVMLADNEDWSDCVELWYDKRKARGGFLWRIPRGHRTEFGAMGRGVSFRDVERFFGLDKMRVRSKAAAPIPIGVVKTYAARLLLAGDSACQTKPWSGGGITYGLLAARAAAKVIMKAVRSGDFSEDMLSRYEDRWKKVLFRDIQAGLVLRELYEDLEGGGLSRIMKNLGYMKGMEQRMDFDFPFSTLLGGSLGV
jgi:digeranylgeranylglycerophospholipid reductase